MKKLLLPLLLAFATAFGANVQIRDLATTVVLPASNTYLIVDGATQGTAKALLATIPQITSTRATLAALSVTNVSTGVAVQTLGGVAVADGLGALFYYNSSSTATPNGTTVIQPTVGSGRWLIVTTAGLPPPSTTSLGGVYSKAAVASQWLTSLGTDGTFGQAGITIADVSGLGSIASQNSNAVTITGGSVTGITDITVADGGTGASTAAGARTNLGVTATGGDTTYVFRANNLSDLASASASRTNLGLGTIATQAASSVSITGGSLTGVAITSSTLNSTVIGGVTPALGTFSGVVVTSASVGATSLTVANTSSGGHSYTFSSLGSGAGSPPVGSLTISDGTAGWNNLIFSPSDGSTTLRSLQGTPIGSVTPSTVAASTLTVSGTATLNGATTYATLAPSSNANLRTTKGSNHLRVNVKDYGAVGDGATDDTAAIAAAVAALTNYSELFFPAGKYNVSGVAGISGITGLRIYGENAVIYQTVQANNTFYIDRTCSFVTMDHLVIDGAASSRLNGVGIRFDASNSRIESVTVSHQSDFGFYVGQHNNATATTNVQVINCTSKENQGDGFHFGNVDGVQVTACLSYKSGDDAFAAVGYEAYARQALNLSFVGCRAYSDGTVGFRGMALLMVKGVTVSDFRAEGMIGAGIEVGDDGNNSGVFNEDVVIRNSDMSNCITSAGPYAAFNLYFAKRLTLENCTVTDPVTASCVSIGDFDDLQISNCDVLVTRAGFARGIIAHPGSTINGRSVRTTWSRLNIAGFRANLQQADNNEAIYIDPNAVVSIANVMITGVVAYQVPTGNYIVYGRLATAAKIGNNTCLQSRSIATTGTGIAATTFNNN